VIALAQIDSRYFRGLESNYEYALSFVIFKFGEDEPVGWSRQNGLFRSRSVNLELNLDEGLYVVHVRPLFNSS
jgi:hypothetical protein